MRSPRKLRESREGQYLKGQRDEDPVKKMEKECAVSEVCGDWKEM